MPGGIGGTPAGKPDDDALVSSATVVRSNFTLGKTSPPAADLNSGDFVVNGGGPTAGTTGMVGREERLGRAEDVCDAMAMAASARPTVSEPDTAGASDGELAPTPVRPANPPDSGSSESPPRPLVPDITEAGVPAAGWAAEAAAAAESKDLGREMAVEGGGERREGPSSRAGPGSPARPMEVRARLSVSLIASL
eukprot:CAMPEP_0170173338 /NCGR_PEP_ID=MMETSP0040_2-20121228/6610_1 /TAXON_ID=641309 /ORGANISM="Lotharella oceanica, Strain CCMP622" /LENGTH=193 /DNA_ID=CAMNT_0010414467 /DNA_START=734 /DNA_END=1315 /DNA_ORIENTATION=-